MLLLCPFPPVLKAAAVVVEITGEGSAATSDAAAFVVHTETGFVPTYRDPPPFLGTPKFSLEETVTTGE